MKKRIVYINIMDKKTIYFINDYAGSPYHGMEFRNYYIAKELVKLGHKVYIITASYMHLFKNPPKIIGEYTFEDIDGINYIWIKVPEYKSSTDKKRVLKWFVFVKKLFFLPLDKMDRPDVVVASPMAPFLIFPSWWLSKKFKSKLFYEVKDIWPLSLMELGGYSRHNPLIFLMSLSEKFALKYVDKVISSLQNYGEHSKKEFEWICNGVDLEELKAKEPLSDDVKKLIPSDKFIIGYTGTIGIANAMDSFCEAAKFLEENRDILFVIVGNGKEKQKLHDKYSSQDNILFIDPIPKKQVQSMLDLFDVCFIGWNKENIYNYGISANKMFDYMYSKKPILNAFSGSGDIIKLSNCGITIEAKNSRQIANTAEEFYHMSQSLRDKLGDNGYNYVLKYFTYVKLAKKFESLF